MIYENKEVFEARVSKMGSMCSDLLQLLNRLKIAEEVTTLTAEQKQETMDTVATYKNEYVATHNSIVEVFLATEEITE